MVCVYCEGPTKVTNSRLQRRANHIWRRRKCLQCMATFTTEESPTLSASLLVTGDSRRLVPFSRDKLFIAVYEACKHRPKAADDAAYLTQVIVGRIIGLQADSVIKREDIIKETAKALKRFDKAAAVVYSAYHR